VEPAVPVPAAPAPAAAPPLAALAAAAPAVPAARGARVPRGNDFATSIGPKLLVATGAVAFVVFLGLFVKYAWENDWVGPTGRVLMGALTGVALVAGGVRLLDRRYRPLGQGLAGAGFASLYVSAFGAHGLYALVPREVAGGLMAAITASAVLLAARRDARLLAALAWLGGYLTPVLLSTGQDRAVALFLYLALLGAGAVALDHRRPWPETLPLAMAGTLLLYAGWFARFFTDEKFGVAASGLVLFTALFTLGAAHKERGGSAGLAVLGGALGLTVLAASANRPEWLLVLSLGLAAGAAHLGARMGRGMAVAAAVAAGLPFLAWALGHYRPEFLGIAAAWVVGGGLLFVVGPARGDDALPLAALVAGGVAAAFLAGASDRPVALLALLLAQAGLALLLARARPSAEPVGVAAGGLAVLAWLDRFYAAGREGDALLLAVPLAGAFLAARVARGLVTDAPLGRAGAAAHLVNATFVWTVLFRVLYDGHAAALGWASVGLAVVYLAVGLGGRRARPADAAGVRVPLGIAAVFVTLAIPVQLGLHGITLAWVAEGVLLVALGLRFRSALARAGGYLVLALAVLRLPLRHWPLHGAEPFAAIANPAFGTWLAVVLGLAAALFLVRREPEAHSSLERAVVPVLATATLGLLFLLLTTEVGDVFDARARHARALGDLAAAESARLLRGLSISVLWTVFATALLAGGLALRSRPLFYAAYGLFAATALKVVMVDLATLRTVYRMLSFLALALLLMAGAYLNLRFRERLLPRGATP
jgi:uncharacterized membrane protein